MSGNNTIGDDEDTPPMGAPTQLIQERCAVTCDKGSRCTREKHDDGHHTTEHGCIAYTFPDGTRETSKAPSEK